MRKFAVKSPRSIEHYASFIEGSVNAVPYTAVRYGRNCFLIGSLIRDAAFGKLFEIRGRRTMIAFLSCYERLCIGYVISYPVAELVYVLESSRRRDTFV